MRALLLLVAVAHADNTVPSPAPSVGWKDRCSEALHRAQNLAIQEEPGFAAGTIRAVKQGLRFDVEIPDKEHGRFFGKPAHYWVEIVEKNAKAPGELGGDVMSPKDPQASAGLTRWTRKRSATIDVQIAEYRKVALFNRLFRPAMDECLR